MRNLDITTLRSFMAVVDNGGVTRAAGVLNLTQSAVSMQLKRLEGLLGVELFDRAGRKLVPTASGEQLLSFAKKIIELNDAAVGRLTNDRYEGVIKVGVPHDVIYPVVPKALAQYSRDFPRVQVELVSSFTGQLHEAFGRGELDIIITTETTLREGGKTLSALPLVWYGAAEGHAFKQRPLRLAYSRSCVFRPQVIAALERVGIDWEMAIDADNDSSVMALASADLAVLALLEGQGRTDLVELPKGHGLPELSSQNINIYKAASNRSALVDAFAELLETGYCGLSVPALELVGKA